MKPSHFSLKKLALLVIATLFCCFSGVAQITVQTGIIPENFIQKLAGKGVSVSNVTWDIGGEVHRLGSYTNAASVFGSKIKNSGIVISTGGADTLADSQNANNRAVSEIYADASAHTNAGIETAFSSLLTTINGSSARQDPAWIEFDVYPKGDRLTIDYSFGSDEYPEVQSSSAKSDVFAFFVNGTNYAVLTNGTPVCPKTVNATTNTGLYTLNCLVDPPVTSVVFGVTNVTYSRTAGIYSTSSVPPVAFNSEYDGFVFGRSIDAPVVTGVANRVVIYLTDDGGSRAADTALFFDEHGINSGSDPSVFVTSTPAVAGSNYAYTVTVSNMLQVAAENVSITNWLPTNVVYVSDTGSLATNSAGAWVGSLGTLGAKASTNFMITVTAPAVGGTLTFSNAIATTTFDADLSNNEAMNVIVLGGGLTPLEITAASDSKVYDGTALSTNGYSISSGSLGAGDTLLSVAVVGSRTAVGSTHNVASGALIQDSGLNDVTANYSLTYVDGTLDVTQRSLEITAASAGKTYDGAALSTNGYSISSGSLGTGDTLLSVAVVGSRTAVGSTHNVVSGALIQDAGLNDVTVNYSLTYVDGTLDVTQRSLEITAASDSKVYDGTALSTNGYSITSGTPGAGDTLVSVTVTGSQTAVGSTNNVASGAVIEDAGANDVTANYSITYVDGVLVVGSAVDLVILLSASSNYLYPDDLSELTMTVSNAGPGDATSVDVSGALPFGLAWEIPFSNPWNLAAGVSTTYTARVRSDGSVTGSVVYSNRVDAAEPELMPADNAATLDFELLGLCDVAVWAVPSATVLTHNGAVLSYTLFVTNRGPGQADGVVLTNVWSEFTLLEGYPVHAATNATSVRIAVGDLASGGWTNYQLNVKVNCTNSTVLTNRLFGSAVSRESSLTNNAWTNKTPLIFAALPGALSVSADWTLDWQLGWFLGTLTITNGSVISYDGAFHYSVPMNSNCWLQFPNEGRPYGTNAPGDRFVDLTEEVRTSLLNTNVYGGNGDTIFDPGEYAVVSNVHLIQRLRRDPSGYMDARSVMVFVDSDEDGLNDAEELLAVGSLEWMDAQSDLDADGYLDRFELVAGSDPLSETSRFVCHHVVKADGGAELVWASVEHRFYRVEFSPSLGDSFEACSEWMPASLPTNRFELSASLDLPQGFWRVRVRVREE